MNKTLIKSLALGLVALSAFAFNILAPTSTSAEAAMRVPITLPVQPVTSIPASETKIFAKGETIPNRIYSYGSWNGYPYEGYLYVKEDSVLEDGSHKVTYSGYLYYQAYLVEI